MIARTIAKAVGAGAAARGARSGSRAMVRRRGRRWSARASAGRQTVFDYALPIGIWLAGAWLRQPARGRPAVGSARQERARPGGAAAGARCADPDHLPGRARRHHRRRLRPIAHRVLRRLQRDGAGPRPGAPQRDPRHLHRPRDQPRPLLSDRRLGRGPSPRLQGAGGRPRGRHQLADHADRARGRQAGRHPQQSHEHDDDDQLLEARPAVALRDHRPARRRRADRARDPPAAERRHRLDRRRAARSPSRRRACCSARSASAASSTRCATGSAWARCRPIPRAAPCCARSWSI